MKLATLCYVKDRNTNKILMLHRIKKENDMHEGKWNGLGGKLEMGESPEECVIREINEEAGLFIVNPKLKGIITFPAFDKIEDWYVFIYTVEEFSGELIDSPEGKLEWIDEDKVSELNLWDGDKIFLQWLKENRFFSAKFVYSEGKLENYQVVFY